MGAKDSQLTAHYKLNTGPPRALLVGAKDSQLKIRSSNDNSFLRPSFRIHNNVLPPFTTSVCPVIKSLTTRPKMASATSSGLAKR